MKKIWLAGLICLGFLSLSFFSANKLSLTSDEVSHLASGYHYLTSGTYFLNPEHPPLVKDLAGLGEMLAGARPIDYNRDDLIANDQWNYGRQFLFWSGQDPERLAWAGRLAVALVNSYLLFLLYLALRKVIGRKEAMVSLILIASSVFVLGQAALVTMDLMSGLLIILALIFWAAYLKQYGQERWAAGYFSLAGLFFVLALLTKFSALILFPSAIISGVIYLVIKKNKWTRVLALVVRFFSFGLLVFALVGLIEGLHLMGASSEELVMQVYNNYYINLPFLGRDLLNLGMQGNLLFRGLAEYFLGATMVFGRMAGGLQRTYFLGHLYLNEPVGWIYWPVLYVTKMAWGFLLLLVGGIFFAIKENFKFNFRNLFYRSLWLSWLGFCFLYLAFSLSGNLQIGLRHLMPVILILFIVAGKIIGKYWQKTRWIFLGAVILILGELILSWPYFLSHYNVPQGYEIATDSNYDWGGQEVKLLAQWQQENNPGKLYVDIFTNVPLEYYLGEEIVKYNIEDGWVPDDGLIVVSMFRYQNNRYFESLNKYSSLQLKEKIGKTILIFE